MVAKKKSAPADTLRLPDLPLVDGLPVRHFRAFLIDPPWSFKSYAESKNIQSERRVERHYKTMTLADIKALPIKELAHPDGAHLFMWVPGPSLPLAFDIIKQWDFKYSAMGFVWIKLKKSHDKNQLRILPSADGDFHVGLGFTTRKNCEFVLLARRGNARRIAKNVRELIIAPRREHSRKPDETNVRVEQYCAGPYLELFGRRELPGWTVRGDEVTKFNLKGSR